MKRAIALLLCFTTVTALAQELPRTSETVEVSIVNVDVVVTDRKGNRVRGLTRDDFEILENKQPQPISNFAEYAATAAQQGGAGAAAEAAPREKRHVLIFYEKMQLPSFSADRIGDALKAVARDILGPADTLSLVIWENYKIRHHEFSSDPAKIARSLEQVVSESKKIAFNPRQFDNALSEEERKFRAEAEAISASVGTATPTSEAARLLGGNLNSSLYLQREYHLMQRRVDAINSAITTMAGLEGKKILILATRRLGEVAGSEAIYASGSLVIPQHLRALYGTEKMMNSIIANANASGVTIYPVYPPGLDTLGDIPTAVDHLILQNETASHERIATQTGGKSAAGAKNIAEMLPTVASDATDYYSLAYRAKAENTDRTRAIVVRARNPEYIVRARTQIVEKSDETRMHDRLRATLFQPDPQSQIDIVANAIERKRSGRRYTVPVEVKIPIRQLTMVPSGSSHSGKFSVYVAAASELNELSDVSKKTQPFDVPGAQLKKALASHYTYQMDVKVDGRSRYIAVGVMDEVGRTYGLQRIELKGLK